MSPSLMYKSLGQAGKSVLTLQRTSPATRGRGGVEKQGDEGGEVKERGGSWG